MGRFGVRGELLRWFPPYLSDGLCRLPTGSLGLRQAVRLIWYSSHLRGFRQIFLMFWDPWGLGGVWQGSGWGLGGSERGLVLSIEPCAPRHGVAGEVRERSGRDLGGIWVRLCAVREGSGIEPCAPRHGVAGLWRTPRLGWLRFGGG